MSHSMIMLIGVLGWALRFMMVDDDFNLSIVIMVV